jgi:hypothetical protein
MAKEVFKKIRRPADFNVRKTWSHHPDALEALERLAKKYGKKYGEGAVRKQLVSFGILALEKHLNDLRVKPSEDIEQVLGI